MKRDEFIARIDEILTVIREYYWLIENSGMAYMTMFLDFAKWLLLMMSKAKDGLLPWRVCRSSSS